MNKNQEQKLKEKTAQLEKELAEKSRELEIEAALEKVRARTMAMQHSNELQDTALLLFQQVLALGVSQLGCGFNIWDDDRKAFTSFMGGGLGENTLVPPFKLSTSEDVFLLILQSAERGESLFIREQGGEELVTHYRYMFSMPVWKEIMGDFTPPTFQVVHCAFFSHGFLMFISTEPVPEAHEIFKRFGKVFGQTYTRFLDLQKAEAQTRESQIQLALERVRAKSMAMHQSNDLAETASLLFQQLQDLGLSFWRTGFYIWQKDEAVVEGWTSNGSGGVLPSLFLPFKEDDGHSGIYEASLRGELTYEQVLEGEELARHYKWLMSQPTVPRTVKRLKESGFTTPDKQYKYAAIFKQGYLLLIAIEPQLYAIDLLKRFAKVFEQTYTRFLDLQKAEEQAREAQIEAALEKVRSRSLAMHKSDELPEVVRTVFDRLNELHVIMNAASIFIFKDGSNDLEQWVALSGHQYSTCFHLSYFNLPMFRDLKEAREKGKDSFVKEYSFQEKNDWFRFAFEHTDYRQLPDSRKKYLLESESAVFSYALTKNTGLQLANYDGQLFSEREIEILKRFARVFEQAYIRFLDLQKAEVQAREAIKASSLDRVRGEIASMRNTSDLDRITPLIWKELTALGISFIRCGVFIMDEQQNKVHSYLSTPDGSAIAAFNTPLETPGNLAGAIDNWYKQKIYVTHWVEKDFIVQADELVQQGAITSRDQYLNTLPKEGFHLHFLPFMQGMLYVGSMEPLHTDDLQLVQALADAFSVAYARYEDFTNLEAAKQQVEKTLVDLKQAQQQLVQSEKMASLGELTAGIAHEIQNPLNFVNNFSEVNKELLEELKEKAKSGNNNEVIAIANDITANEEKINHHGKRADAIVKGMLQHSRSSTGVKEPTDINALCDEYLRLSYHGLRAKDKSFSSDFKTDFDNSIGKINIVPQDIGRVLLNLINNAFYAVNERQKITKESYLPTVFLSSKKIEDKVILAVKDNGNGIPQSIVDKIFQPFFTTKPTGQGTGLGLSLSYDIIKAHGGELSVQSEEDTGATFTIEFPIT